MYSRKALIADPAEEFREALAHALSPGFQVICCARGDEIPGLLASEKPDLLIMELSLPGLDGISLLEQLSERPPVLVVTDLISPYVHNALMRLQVEYAILKPTSIHKVADRAFDLVRQSRFFEETGSLQEVLIRMRLPSGRSGFQHLLTGLPLLAQNRRQQLSKELYDTIALLDNSTPSAVEKAIREVIRDGWVARDPQEWNRYFPGLNRCPKNKEFLFRMADLFRERQRCG